MSSGWFTLFQSMLGEDIGEATCKTRSADVFPGTVSINIHRTMSRSPVGQPCPMPQNYSFRFTWTVTVSRYYILLVFKFSTHRCRSGHVSNQSRPNTKNYKAISPPSSRRGLDSIRSCLKMRWSKRYACSSVAPPPILTRTTSGVCKPHPEQHSVQARWARPCPPRAYRRPHERRNTTGFHPGRDVRLLDTSLISVSLAM